MKARSPAHDKTSIPVKTRLSSLLPLSPRLGGPLLAIASLLTLAACAPVQPALPHVGRAQLELPPGDWEVLGRRDEVIDVLPDDTSADLPTQMTAMGLRGPGKDRPLLAVLLVQTNSTNYPRDTTLWTAPCPQQQGVFVEDKAQGSPARIDCLRYKRRADTEDYLAKNRPAVSQWLSMNQAAPAKPYSHVFFRYATNGGAIVTIDALVDQRLLRPPTRDNEAFLRAGRPALEWGDKMAQAARLSTAMMDGRLIVPPFPVAPPQ